MAACLTTEPFPANRPPWSATFVTGLPDGAINHVLADGAAGLTLLAALLDPRADPGATTPQPAAPARPRPSRLSLPHPPQHLLPHPARDWRWGPQHQ